MCGWINDKIIDSKVCDSSIAGAPEQATSRALENAAAKGSCVENNGNDRINSQGWHGEVVQTGVHRNPDCPPVRALEDPAALGAGVQNGRHDGIDSQGADSSNDG